jgi:hypothetical protein
MRDCLGTILPPSIIHHLWIEASDLVRNEQWRLSLPLLSNGPKEPLLYPGLSSKTKQQKGFTSQRVRAGVGTTKSHHSHWFVVNQSWSGSTSTHTSFKPVTTRARYSFQVRMYPYSGGTLPWCQSLHTRSEK